MTDPQAKAYQGTDQLTPEERRVIDGLEKKLAKLFGRHVLSGGQETPDGLKFTLHTWDDEGINQISHSTWYPKEAYLAYLVGMVKGAELAMLRAGDDVLLLGGKLREALR